MARKSESPTSAAPSPVERAQADALLAHVARVLAPAGPAAGQLARTDWVVARPGPESPTPAPTATVPAGGRRLGCAGCGWQVDCLAADAARFAAAGCPQCGQGLGEVPRPDAASALQPHEKRRRPRRSPTGSVRVAVRRVADPAGKDLAVALVDVCAEGLGVWLTEAIAPGEIVSVVMTRKGKEPIAAEAEVRWSAPSGGVTHRAGLRLRRDLTRAELAELAL